MGQPAFSQFTDKKLWNMMRPYIPRVLVAIVFSLAVAGAGGAIAWILKPLVDSVSDNQNYEMLTWLPLAIIAIYFIRGSCQMVYSYLMRSAGIKLVRDTRINLYTHLLHLPTSALGTESSGKIISRILNDAAMLRSLVSDTLLTIFKEMPTILVLLGVALYRSWDITLLALVAVPGIIACANGLGKSIKTKRGQAQMTAATLTHRISEAVTGAKVIKVFTSEDSMAKQFIQESQSNYRREVKIVRLREIAKLVVDLSTGIGIGLVVWYGGNLVSKGTITSGDLASALGAVAMIFSPIKNLGNSYTVFQEIRAAVDRLSWLEEMVEEKSGDQPLPGFAHEIRFQDVSHAYLPGGEHILRDINLTINKGDVLAIVGASGAGKTTLIDLLPRFNDPIKGAILIDGHDIKDVRLADLRKQIGMVSQDVMLFNDTVRANLSFSCPEASDHDIEEAARMAFAHDFILELPEGYQTLLGERGLNLSGGQRQRLAIARAILKNPPLLILDEATSALDSVSEQLVQKALDQLMQDRTTIVVAHRLSTIRNADRIVVMEHGQITSQGSHDELMAQSAIYQELYLSYNQIKEQNS